MTTHVNSKGPARRLYPISDYVAHQDVILRSLEGLTGLKFAILFGSAGAGRPFHDLDIALWLDRAVSPPENDLDLILDLAGQLERRTPFPVDVRVVNEAPLGFRYNVSKGKLLLAHDREAFYTFRERTWDEYLDFEPVARKYFREFL